MKKKKKDLLQRLKNINFKKAQLGFDRCVICTSYTDNLIDTPINIRDYYVEGVGEHCKSCFRGIYGK